MPAFSFAILPETDLEDGVLRVKEWTILKRNIIIGNKFDYFVKICVTKCRNLSLWINRITGKTISWLLYEIPQ